MDDTLELQFAGPGSGSVRILQAAQRSLTTPSLRALSRPSFTSPGRSAALEDRCNGCDKARRDAPNPFSPNGHRRPRGVDTTYLDYGKRTPPTSLPGLHLPRLRAGGGISSSPLMCPQQERGRVIRQGKEREDERLIREGMQAMLDHPSFPDLQPPDPESWQRAVAYRINNTFTTKSSGRKVIRNRKKKVVVDNDLDVSKDMTDPPKRSLSRPSTVYSRRGSPPPNPEDDERVLLDEEDDINLLVTSGTTEEEVYACACRRLGVVPVAGLGRRLSTTELPLKNRAMGPRGARACAMVLVNNVNVKKLDLEGNDIGSEGTLYIADMLRENLTITDLNLTENCIEAEGLIMLCAVLKEYGRIKVLDLSGNNLQDKDAQFIGKMLEENRTIRELYLAHNTFSETAGEYLAPSIATNDALELLDLSWNHLRLHGAVALVMGLKDNSSLSTLNLAWNGLHVEGCRAFKEVLMSTTTLTYLDLSCNRINCHAIKILLEGLKKNRSLSVLKLGYNPITNEGAILIMKTLEERGNDLPLRELDLTDLCVDASFIKYLKNVRKKRFIVVKHGVIMKNDELGLRPKSDPFCLDDPMTVLMEFMRVRNLRLIDLFACLDKDGNKSLSREEFRDGLMSVNIPLSTHALNQLIDKLDTDGDGEVDFSELLEGQKQHKKRIARLLGRDQELTRVSGLDSEISRVNTKIRALIAMTSLAARAKHRDQRPSTSSWDKLLPVSPGSVGDSQEVASRRLFGRVLAGDMARTTSVEPEQEEH